MSSSLRCSPSRTSSESRPLNTGSPLRRRAPALRRGSDAVTGSARAAPRASRARRPRLHAHPQRPGCDGLHRERIVDPPGGGQVGCAWLGGSQPPGLGARSQARKKGGGIPQPGEVSAPVSLHRDDRLVCRRADLHETQGPTGRAGTKFWCGWGVRGLSTSFERRATPVTLRDSEASSRRRTWRLRPGPYSSAAAPFPCSPLHYQP